MSRVPSAKRANGFPLPKTSQPSSPKTHKRKIPPPSPKLTTSSGERPQTTKRSIVSGESTSFFFSKRSIVSGASTSFVLLCLAFGFVAFVLRLSNLTQKLNKIKMDNEKYDPNMSDRYLSRKKEFGT